MWGNTSATTECRRHKIRSESQQERQVVHATQHPHEYVQSEDRKYGASRHEFRRIGYVQRREASFFESSWASRAQEHRRREQTRRAAELIVETAARSLQCSIVSGIRPSAVPFAPHRVLTPERRRER